MALTSINKSTPLAALRAEGIDADFSRCRLIVFPRQKVTNEKLAFVRTNLVAIVDELNLEAHYSKKPDPLGYAADSFRYSTSIVGQGYFMFGIGEPERTQLGGLAIDDRDIITDAMNGYIDH